MDPLQNTCIVIDPDHGGADPGTVSRKFNIKEKDGFSYSPVLTKRNDVSLSLKSTCDTARLCEAAVFPSVHCNAREARGRPGIELEAFHFKGSEPGKELAQLVLKDLVEEVGRVTTCIDRGIKTANFYVLKHTPMPVVLVELDFLTDPEEAVFLSNLRNQRILARSLSESLELFLEGRSYE